MVAQASLMQYTKGSTAPTVAKPRLGERMDTEQLVNEQLANLQQSHFLVLYWLAQAEDKRQSYNVTNCFDDLKDLGITRTKQNAVAIITALRALRFVDSEDRGNRRNLYITRYGARALEYLVSHRHYTPKPSPFLEEQ